jgi:hypothetical protein
LDEFDKLICCKPKAVTVGQIGALNGLPIQELASESEVLHTLVSRYR